MSKEKLLNNFKILSAVLVLSVMVLTGCNSVESNNKQSNNNKTKTAQPSSSTPTHSGDPADDAKRITIEDARAAWEKNKDNIIFIDTRSPDAYKASHIKGAILLNDFLNRPGVPKDRMIITYCT